MRIRTAIFVVYVAASAVGFAVLMRYMLAEVRPRYVNALHFNLEAAARLLAASLDRRPELAVEALREADSGLRVRIVRDDGAVLLDTSDSAETEVEDYSVASSGLAKRAAIGLLDERPLDGATEIGASAPLTFADGRSGTVVLSRPIRTVNAFVWAERKRLASIGLLIAAVMLIAGWWIAARLTHAIEKLTVYAQAVRDGRRVAPPRSRAREIATLTKAFDEMRDALEGRQHAERYTQALAHEVKAPLAAIRGAAELLDEAMPEEQRRKFMANIRGESARIEQIVERLLELSSLEARKALRQTE
ncbi:MAG TPA: histidine kinase dimerization/phospho-acceptor domain-containing protein, partial [Opitutus sp.]|nr:histidine kinase dimerization/phospho-acceptor domain-containing protein [Opitutus sp.]